MVQTKKRKSPHRAAQETSVVPVHRWFQFLESQNAQKISLPVTIIFALLIRWCISLHGYSGRHTLPLYGDYEAQRHWMELTLHLPPSKWYYYDLQYWGLDYPPLTAFQSWLCGVVANAIDPSWVALGDSRGIETHSSKLFMRASVVVLEFVTLVPAVVLLFRLENMQMSWAARQACIFSILMQPCLLLVDHGHFQYNAVMLGFLVWAVYFAAREQHVLMAISFCCSFMFKQMGLYFAPAVFFFLFAQCFRLRRGGLLFVKLGVAVLGSVGTMLLPWIRSLDQLQQILIRVFPVARGLYEDKVANVWCAVNVVIKLRSLFDTQALVRLSTIATAIAFLPSCLHMFFMLWRQNSRYNNTTASSITLLRYCLLNTSLAFFLFSFQVHEKSILLPLAAALLLVDKEEWAVNWFVQVALFSLYPLLFKDGLCLPYWVMAVGWSLLRSCPACPRDLQTPPAVIKMQWLTTLGMLAIHLCDALLVPPASLPNIFVVLNVLCSCGMFVLFFVYFYYRQFVILSTDVDATKQKAD